jgi:hypothetical protein
MHAGIITPLLVIYPKLCSLFTRRFAHFPEFGNSLEDSLEKGLTTPRAQVKLTKVQFFCLSFRVTLISALV